jgi:hypothetical protein
MSENDFVCFASTGVKLPLIAMTADYRPSSVHPLIFLRSFPLSVLIILTLDVTRNNLLFLRRDRQLPGQADQRFRIR